MAKKSVKKTQEEVINKVLDFSTLQQKDKETYSQIEIDAKGYPVLVDIVFRPTKIQNLISELISNQDYMSQNNIQMNVGDHLLMLAVKHFTNLSFPNNLEKDIQMFNLLIDGGYFEPIINQFPQDQFMKITDSLKKSSENLNKFYDEMINNPELLNGIVADKKDVN